MPRTRSLAWSELKVGVLTIVAIVIAAVLVFSLTGSRGFFWQRYLLKTRFPNVAGLAPGSPVRVAGVQVGSVKSTEFAGDQIDVTFEVNTEVRDKITDKSTAVLGSVSLLGESAVDISPSSGGTPIPEYGYVPSTKPKGSLSDVAELASTGIEQITQLVADVRNGKGTVGKLMTDERLYADLQEFANAANEMARSARAGRGTIGKLLNDPGAANQLEASLKNVEQVTRRISEGEGSIGKLIKDDAFSQSLTQATNGLREVTDKINRGDGTVGKLMTDATLFNRLTDVSTRFGELAAKLNEGEGTAGQLLKDKQLYENMNGAVADFRRLLNEISKDPKKYLNVKVSIF
jgi:phospholipid/cholesterol/gamma-HCH transport system substrate-binding protein